MKLKSIFAAAFVAAATLVGSAQASPSWTWFEQGIITSGIDGLGLFGAEDRDLTGLRFTKTFAVSVDPSNYTYEYNNSLVTYLHGVSSVPFTMTLTVDGITLNKTETTVIQGQESVTAGALWPGSYYPDQIFSSQYGYDSLGNNLDSMDYAKTSDPAAAFVPAPKFDQSITVSNVAMFSYFYTDNGITPTWMNGKPDFITVSGNDLPEPTSIALLGLGIAGMSVLRRRKAS
jgi:hypothetical protein